MARPATDDDAMAAFTRETDKNTNIPVLEGPEETTTNNYTGIPQEIRDLISDHLEGSDLLNLTLTNKMFHQNTQPRVYARCTLRLAYGYEWPAQRVIMNSGIATPIYRPIPDLTAVLPHIQNIDIQFNIAKRSKCNYPHMPALERFFYPIFEYAGTLTSKRQLCQITLDCPNALMLLYVEGKANKEYFGDTMAMAVIKRLTGFDKLAINIKQEREHGHSKVDYVFFSHDQWKDIIFADISKSLLETLGSSELRGSPGTFDELTGEWTDGTRQLEF